MLKHKFTTAIALLMAFSFTITAPAAPAYASPLSSLVSQSDSGNSSSGSGIINVLLGLLIGKLFSNMTSTAGSSATPSISSLLGSNASGTTSTSSTSAASAGEASATGQAIIATGEKYMGVPYVWGGETPDGFDCSGFTQYVMKENGISLPRTAAEQYATGTPVDKANLRIGDLVFFTTYKPGASHVGFYMGDGKFLHASSAAKKVTINSLDEKFYTDHYIGARRYF